MAEFISDIITNPSVFRPNVFNLITASCGSGKSYFVANRLRELFPDVRTSEILFVTSRSITVDQHVAQYDTVRRFDCSSLDQINYWQGSSNLVEDGRINLMTFDKFILLVTKFNRPGYDPFSRVKIIVIDECHALASDDFIKDKSAMLVYMSAMLRYTNKIVIGLTATPNILYETGNLHGFLINEILKDPLVRYKAKQLIVTRSKSISTLLTSPDFTGRTIVMCQTYGAAQRLRAQIPNSAILISASNKDFDQDDMGYIRDYIIEHEEIPPTYKVTVRSKGEIMSVDYFPLDVLITTTVSREGISIRESSGVRNVVSCFADDMHVTQFLGRCRYSVDRLIVCQDPVRGAIPTEYMSRQRDKFQNFLDGQSNEWFGTIRDLVEHEVQDTIFYEHCKDEDKFHEYITTKWLCEDKSEVGEKLLVTTRIDEIIQMADDCGIFREIKEPRKSRVKLWEYIEDRYGYKISRIRPYIDGVQTAGILITK